MVQVTADERTRTIRETAYFRAAQRGFIGGSAIEDWLEGERYFDHTSGSCQKFCV